LTAAATSSYAAEYEKDKEGADNEGTEDNPSAPVRPRARVIAVIVVIITIVIVAIIVVNRSREEDRHFEDGVDVTLKFRDVDCLMWLLRMLKVCRKTKIGTGICKVDVTQTVRDLGSRTAWNGGYDALFERD